MDHILLLSVNDIELGIIMNKSNNEFASHKDLVDNLILQVNFFSELDLKRLLVNGQEVNSDTWSNHKDIIWIVWVVWKLDYWQDFAKIVEESLGFCLWIFFKCQESKFTSVLNTQEIFRRVIYLSNFLLCLQNEHIGDGLIQFGKVPLSKTKFTIEVV